MKLLDKERTLIRKVHKSLSIEAFFEVLSAISKGYDKIGKPGLVKVFRESSITKIDMLTHVAKPKQFLT